jgi:hypothetical protein
MVCVRGVVEGGEAAQGRQDRRKSETRLEGEDERQAGEQGNL